MKNTFVDTVEQYAHLKEQKSENLKCIYKYFLVNLLFCENLYLIFCVNSV